MFFFSTRSNVFCFVSKKYSFIRDLFLGMDEVGIYRLSGIASEIQNLKKLFNESTFLVLIVLLLKGLSQFVFI